MNKTNSNTTVVPEPLRSPGSLAQLTLQDDAVLYAAEARVGRRIGSVWSFMDEPDGFYEGKFNNRTRYVPLSDNWFATLPLRIVLQNYPTTIAAEVPKGATVVEIGCAGGVSWFGQLFRMIGLDLSQAALQLAAKDYELALQCDATLMPLADCSVDAVISSYLFEHLSDSQKTALLSEAFRVLKPGGKLIFLYDLATENVLIAGYRQADLHRYKRLFLDNDGHLGYRSVDQNRDFFRHAGFRIKREIFNERTPFLSNSVWKKFADWPGWRGRIGQIGDTLTSGMMHLPMMAALYVIDATIGRMFPKSHARGMITVAEKL